MTTPEPIIHRSAREVLEATFESGAKRTTFYERDGERVGFRPLPSVRGWSLRKSPPSSKDV